MSSLNRTISEVDACIREYRFSEATDAIYHFFWHEYCNQYIECAKVSFRVDDIPQQNVAKSVLIHLLDASMRMLHPFCPFISEEIWQHLPTKAHYRAMGVNYCAVAPFPVVDPSMVNNDAEEAIRLIFDVSTMIKNGRQSSDLPANLAVPVQLLARDESVKNFLAKNTGLITHLAKTSSIAVSVRGEVEINELCVTNSSSAVDTVILLSGLIDVEKELNRLDSALEKLNKQKDSLEKRLANVAFVANAPVEVVNTHKKELSEIIEKQEQLRLGKIRLMQSQKA